MVTRWTTVFCGMWLIAATTIPAAAEKKANTAPRQVVRSMTLHTRLRVPAEKQSNRFHTITRSVEWNPKQTAIVVCDMWDLHHCLNATRRVGEMAPRMNRVLTVARSRGATIIHAPSSCTKSYEDHPARKHVLTVPRSKNLPKEIGSWCYVIPEEQKGVYPIDQSDGGEDDDAYEHRQWAARLTAMGRNPRAPWKSQIITIEMQPGDFISDNGEEIEVLLDCGFGER